MAHGSARSVLHYLRGLVLARGAGDLTDAQLLERFTRQNDEAAFEAIVQRHGPLVWGVCRRVLGERTDAEDAFQATFLVLIRKAGTLAQRELLGNWLYGVATRVAQRARQSSSRQPVRLAQETLEATPARTEPEDARDLGRVLDEEVQRLPARYRLPFVLCYLEGLTNEQAANRIGCPKGTVLSRLSRARERLRSRLERRGIAVTGALLTAVLTPTAEAALPPILVESTVRSAALVAAGEAAAGVLSARALALSEGVLRVMFLSKCRMALLVLVFLGACGGIGLHVLHQSAAQADTEETAQKDRVRNAPAANGPLVRIPAPQEGILLLKDEPSRGSGDDEKTDRQGRLIQAVRAGDFVRDGQLLGRIEDQLPRFEVATAKATLKVTEADQVAAEKTRDEAYLRWQTSIKLRGSGEGAITDVDLREVKLAHDRLFAEAIQKRERVQQAKAHLARAEAIVKLHEIRSPAAGILRSIEKQHGEAVRRFETVFLLERSAPPAGDARSFRERNWIELPAQREGILLAVGTPAEGKVSAGSGFVIELAGVTQAFRSLREGDSVEAGQILGRIDDRLARADLEAAQTRTRTAREALDHARINLEASAKRLQRLQQMATASVLSQEGLDAARLTVQGHESEVRTKELEIQATQSEVTRAQTVVDMHVIRSPVSGTIDSILKKRGEAVRAYEPVFRIQPEDR